MNERDPNRPFNQAELRMIQLAIGHLSEFHAGFVHVYRLRRRGLAEANPELNRFLETALIAVLDGLYPSDRNRGLLPALRLVNCNAIADRIEAALDRRIGSSTFAEIQKVYRNKAIAHPHYTLQGMQLIVDTFQMHLQKQEDIEAFCEASGTLSIDTGEAYHWFRRNYPKLVAHARSIE